MQLVVYVMNKPEKLEAFLKALNNKQIKGATIINSTGMGRKLAGNEDIPWIGSLKAILDTPRTESHVILIALPDDQVNTVYEVIETISGDLMLPNSGIAFSIPISSIKGYKG